MRAKRPGSLLLLWLTAVAVILAGRGQAKADLFFNLNGVTPGSSGSFSGTLDGVSVNGSLSTNTTTVNGGSTPFYQLNGVINPPGGNFDASTTGRSSPQYSYSNIYTASQPLSDQVGYTMWSGQTGTATLTVTFGQPLTNPIFHVANLDEAVYSFQRTAGYGGLVLLRGNGGTDGDGLTVVGNTIEDGNPLTLAAQPTTDTPFTFADARSAYGSIEILGTFSTLTLDIARNPALVSAQNFNGDGGSFTFSVNPAFLPTQTLPATVPEPSTLVLLGLGGLALAGWRQRKQTAPPPGLPGRTH